MHLLFETTPDGAGRYIDWILSGLVWTLSLAFGAWAIALVVGTLVGVARTIKGGIWPRLGRVYVETFRNIPLLVQMFFWYFVLPEILPQRIGFAIKQMSKWGVRCILIRDLTDAMYNPKSSPRVSHAQGTELIIEHIEKYWAPTTTSLDLLAALK